jgi:hypothetical protein
MTTYDLLACYGIMFAVRKLSTGLALPDLLWTMIHCPYCLGFHVGWIWYLFSQGPTIGIVDCVRFAFAAGTFSYALDVLTLWLESGISER